MRKMEDLISITYVKLIITALFYTCEYKYECLMLSVCLFGREMMNIVHELGPGIQIYYSINVNMNYYFIHIDFT